MKSTIFYSWQSDLPNATNRSFIQKALENIAKSIRKDGSIDVEPVVDRDTQGVSGSPDIASTIFKKIEKCQVFVPDVSIINSGTKARPSPNPNVLIELGYAIKILGWEQIIMVMNKAFGNLKELPFDLLKKRVLTYDMPEDVSERATERKHLESILREGLGLIFGAEGDAQSAVGFYISEESLKPFTNIQTAPSGVTLYHYSREQRDNILNLFPTEHNIAKTGKATSSGHYKNRIPQIVFTGNRLGTCWTLNDEIGWFEATWETPIKGRYLLLINRRSKPGADPWGPAAIFINGDKITELEYEFSGSSILLIDLGKRITIEKLHIDINGSTYPGLSDLEIY